MPTSVTTNVKRRRKSKVREHILNALVNAALKNPDAPLLSQEDMRASFSREAVNRQVQVLLRKKLIEVHHVEEYNKKFYKLTRYGLLYALKQGFLTISFARKVREAFNIKPSHDNDLRIMWDEIEASDPETLYKELMNSGIVWIEDSEVRFQDLEMEGNLTLGHILIRIMKENPSIKQRIVKRMIREKGNADVWISTKPLA